LGQPFFARALRKRNFASHFARKRLLLHRIVAVAITFCRQTLQNSGARFIACIETAH